MQEARDPEALLRRFFEEVLTGRGRAAAEELVAPSFADHDPLPMQEGGRDGLLAAIEVMHEALSDLHYEPLLVIPDDSRVAAHWRMTGTSTGPLLGRPPNGDVVQVTGVDVLGIRDGRVQERWSQWERHLLFGMGPPPGAGGG